MEHLAENLSAYFCDKELKIKFKLLYQQKRESMFVDIWRSKTSWNIRQRKKAVLIRKHSRSPLSMVRKSLKYKAHSFNLIQWRIRRNKTMLVTEKTKWRIWLDPSETKWEVVTAAWHKSRRRGGRQRDVVPCIPAQDVLRESVVAGQ
jgi:hypothetical protein